MFLAYDNMCHLATMKAASRPLPLPSPLNDVWHNLTKIIDLFICLTTAARHAKKCTLQSQWRKNTHILTPKLESKHLHGFTISAKYYHQQSLGQRSKIVQTLQIQEGDFWFWAQLEGQRSHLTPSVREFLMSEAMYMYYVWYVRSRWINNALYPAYSDLLHGTQPTAVRVTGPVLQHNLNFLQLLKLHLIIIIRLILILTCVNMRVQNNLYICMVECGFQCDTSQSPLLLCSLGNGNVVLWTSRVMFSHWYHSRSTWEIQKRN